MLPCRKPTGTDNKLLFGAAREKKKKKVLKVRAVVSRILVWIVALLMIFQSRLFITIFIY